MPDTAETMDVTITSAVLQADTLVSNVLIDSPAATACRERTIANSPITKAATTSPQAGGNSPPMVAPASATIDKAATIIVSVLGFIEILSLRERSDVIESFFHVAFFPVVCHSFFNGISEAECGFFVIHDQLMTVAPDFPSMDFCKLSEVSFFLFLFIRCKYHGVFLSGGFLHLNKSRLG
jgi:hypothetical protein